MGMRQTSGKLGSRNQQRRKRKPILKPPSKAWQEARPGKKIHKSTKEIASDGRGGAKKRKDKSG